MLDALDITEEEAQGLAELAQHDLAMARDFARRAQAAEDADEANRLARSYQRAARSYRQTLALKARLKRELAAAAQAQAQVQAATPRPKPGGAAVARRIGELREALMRLTWAEAERSELDLDEDERGTTDAAFGLHDLFTAYVQELAGLISEECLKDSFCDEPLDDHVARLALDLGLQPEEIALWRDLPDPPRHALDPWVEPEAPKRDTG